MRPAAASAAEGRGERQRRHGQRDGDQGAPGQQRRILDQLVHALDPGPAARDVRSDQDAGGP